MRLPRTHTGSVLVMGMLDAELMLTDRPRVMANVALRAGSSRQGNAWRASVGWNCVTASHLSQKAPNGQVRSSGGQVVLNSSDRLKLDPNIGI